MWGHNPDCRLVKKLEYYQKSGRTKNFSNPQYCVAMEDKEIDQVSCGTSHTLILDTSGYVYSAGSPDNGQLGTIFYNFNPKTCQIPYIIMQGFTISDPAVKICASDGFSLILNRMGHVFSCGKGNFGRLGQGNQISMNNPTKI